MKNRYLKIVFRHTIVWFFAFILWTLFREFGQEIIREEGEPTILPLQRIPFHIVLGLFAGLIFGTLEFYFDKYIYKKISFGRSLLIGAISYLVAIILLVTFGIRAFTRIVGVELDWQIFQGYVFRVKCCCLRSIVSLSVFSLISFVRLTRSLVLETYGRC